MANIGATTAFYKVETSLTRANNEVSKSMERLATGKQNANAGDRSSYAAMADTFRLDYVGTKAGIKGASVVMGYLETGMRVLDAAAALLARLQELAVLGANDTNSVSDHEAINLEAEAIAQEFNRLMNSATYKGKDIFVDTAGSEYVSMGGRNAEMTFGIGKIDYTEVFGATREIDAGLPNAGQLMNLTSMPSDAVVGPTSTTTTLTAGKIYEITTLPTNAAELAAYKAVLLASGNTTLQLESEIVVGSTFEVTSATDLEIVAVEYGKAASTGLDNSAALAASKTYVVTTPLAVGADGDENSYDDSDGADTTLAEEIKADTSSIFRGENSDGVAITSGLMEAGDVLVANAEIATTDLDGTIELKEVVTGDTAFVAGQEYAIVSFGAGQATDADKTVDFATFGDVDAIGRASADISDGQVLAVGTTFTVDADASVAELAHLNALTEGMTFKKTTTDAAFREIDASQITRNIEAVQKKINTARVQAGSQYAALESAVIYTTDLTAQYELGYNTVHDVNFSMETAHLAKNQILQQAATAMLAQANQGQQGLLQLIQ
ncbi:flagellin [Paracoccaceae bacterium]|nr:flagellin [Paracoccaceae bacterium]